MELSFVCQYTFLVISSERRNLNPVKYRKVRFDQNDTQILFNRVLLFVFLLELVFLVLSLKY
jgi:hypothetical protein